jgi:hypothetical protein
MKLFKDILKVKVDNGLKYSQGRIYLFTFILIYIAYLIYYMFFPATISQIIIDSLQWAILLFAGYVFAGKGITATKDIFKNKSSDSTTATTTATVTTTATSTAAPAVTKPPSIKNEEDLCT